MAEPAEGATLFSGVNWLGDSIMAMPAIHEFKHRHPSSVTAMLSKPSLVPLWRMNPDIDSVVELHPGPSGAINAARTIRGMRCKCAFVLTQSFRSALVPFLAGIPSRLGMPGHFRDWMLTGVIRPGMSDTRRHQAFEYFDLLGIDAPSVPEAAPLNIAGDITASCRRRIADILAGHPGTPLVGMLPGAAHGPSKRWPASYFREVTKDLTGERGCIVAVFGSRLEVDSGSLITTGLETTTADFCGKTSLPELAAMLSLCDVVLANDSGGMHLAAAVGTPVVAIFGKTDPGKTGPMGHGHRIVASAQTDRSRDLVPDSQAAMDAMLSIRPETVLRAISESLGEGTRRHR